MTAFLAGTTTNLAEVYDEDLDDVDFPELEVSEMETELRKKIVAKTFTFANQIWRS